MRNALLLFIALPAWACSPVPELLFAQQGTDMGDMGIGDMSMFHGRFPGDGGMHHGPGDMSTGMAPCPQPFGATISFCYYPGAPDPQNLNTALEVSPADSNCTLMNSVFSVNAASDVCNADFVSTISSAWGFLSTKPINMAFSYSVKPNTNYETLAIDSTSGMPTEVLRINAVSGNQNTLNLYIPAGTPFTPGFQLNLGGAAKKASLTFNWISLWQ